MSKRTWYFEPGGWSSLRGSVPPTIQVAIRREEGKETEGRSMILALDETEAVKMIEDLAGWIGYNQIDRSLTVAQRKARVAANLREIADRLEAS